MIPNRSGSISSPTMIYISTKNHVKYGAANGSIPKICTMAYLFFLLHRYNSMVKKVSESNIYLVKMALQIMRFNPNSTKNRYDMEFPLNVYSSNLHENLYNSTHLKQVLIDNSPKNNGEVNNL